MRNYESLLEAVKKTIEAFGRIDFVIAGAAGNFLSPVCGSYLGVITVLSELTIVSCDREID